MRPFRSSKLLRLLSALFALALVAAACGNDDDGGGTAAGGGTTTTAATSGGGGGGEVEGDTTGVTDTEIKLGGIYPFSGPLAAYGTIGTATSAYFTKINEEEGGIDGRQINFITRDDQYSPDRTVQAARELIEQEKVFALFNTLGTPPNSAIWDYVNQQKVPHLFVATGASKWGADPESHPWTMGWQPDYVSEGKIYAAYLAENVPDAQIAVLYQNDDYGKDYLDGLKEGLGPDVDKIVKEVTYEATDATVNAQVAELAATGANVFYLVATPKFATQALVAADQQGWRPLILLNSVSASVATVVAPAIEQSSPEAAANLFSTSYLKDPTDPQWDDDEGMQAYREFMAQYAPDANPEDTFNVYGYGVAQTMVHVLKEAAADGGLTRENLMDKARNIRDLEINVLLPGITINTSPTDYYPIQAMQVIKFDTDANTWELIGDVIDASAI